MITQDLVSFRENFMGMEEGDHIIIHNLDAPNLTQEQNWAFQFYTKHPISEIIYASARITWRGRRIRTHATLFWQDMVDEENLRISEPTKWLLTRRRLKFYIHKKTLIIRLGN